MIIKNLTLRNFRNIESCDITFHPGMNFIIGDNAQGKTNLLESLVYLSLTRSHRIANDKKLIKEGALFADIRCTFSDNDRHQQIEAVLSGKGKTLMIQKQPVLRSSEFIGLLNVILFAPDDLKVFSDSPRERRRIMNQEITKISTRYLLSLNRYQNLLKDRNTLLKQYTPDPVYLETLNEKMSEEEVLIMEKRKEFETGINEKINLLYQKISGEENHVNIRYTCCLDTEITKENILELHKKFTQKDIEIRMTNTGIHREDIVFLMNDRNVSEIASQGQKRMVMLAFKFALREYILKTTKKDVVILLDDVLSELDKEKQKKLLQMAADTSQCIITATDLPFNTERQRERIYHVKEGKIWQEELQ